MSSQALEAGLENIRWTWRWATPTHACTRRPAAGLAAVCGLLSAAPRAAAKGLPRGLQIGPTMAWADAAALPLCLLTPRCTTAVWWMAPFARRRHGAARDGNRFGADPGAEPVAGQVCSVLPGALVDAVRGHEGLEALPRPLNADHAHRFMSHRQVQPTRPRCRAGTGAGRPDWLQHAAAHRWTSGRRLSADRTGCGG